MKNLNQNAQSSENKNESCKSSISRRKFLTAAVAAPSMISPLMQNLALAQSNMPGLDEAGKINLKGTWDTLSVFESDIAGAWKEGFD